MMNVLRALVGIAFLIVVAAVVSGYFKGQSDLRAAAETYVRSAGMQATLDGSFTAEAVAPQLRLQIDRKYASQNLSEDQLDRIVVEMTSTLSQDRKITEEQMVTLTPDHFTLDELTAMSAFWNQPIGVTVGAKTLELQSLMQKMIEEDATDEEILETANAFFTQEELDAAAALDDILGGRDAALQRGNAYKAAYKTAASQEMAKIHSARGERVLKIVKE